MANAAMLFALALKYQMPTMEDACFKFNPQNITDVKKTEGYITLDKDAKIHLLERFVDVALKL